MVIGFLLDMIVLSIIVSLYYIVCMIVSAYFDLDLFWVLILPLLFISTILILLNTTIDGVLAVFLIIGAILLGLLIFFGIFTTMVSLTSMLYDWYNSTKDE